MSFIDLGNTEVALRYKTNKELKRSYTLFKVFSREKLSDFLSHLTVLLLKWRWPFVSRIVKHTVFNQFVGGEDLKECDGVIKRLGEFNVLTVLDYAAEGKVSLDELEAAKEEFVKAVNFASTHPTVPVVSIKISALADNLLLEKAQKGALSKEEEREFGQVQERLDAICRQAQEKGISLFVDAEESWIQDAIDELVWDMMIRYNTLKATVYNTYQMYRKDRLEVLRRDYERSRQSEIILGVKLVRGAYMEKERERARLLNIESPIHETKMDTDKDFDQAIVFCVPKYDKIAFCAATHNEISCQKMAEIVSQLNADTNHPHLNFCQLYGMGDHLTFNLAHSGYNVAKYLPYGPVADAMPYLIRRSDENASMSGEMTRELLMLNKEITRRGMK